MKKEFDLARLVIRDYQPRDLPTLIDIDSHCFAKGIAYTEADFQRFLKKKKSATLIGQFGTQIIGFAITVTSSKNKLMHLVTLDILPEWQGKGVGKRLLEHIIRQARRDNVERINLEVAEDNYKAIQFYLNHGFQTVKRLRGYYSEDCHALYMTKVLGSAA
jgi:[ribosomal protein S18]-alanine N-acetyltransferase